jgi:hypothetical protein
MATQYEMLKRELEVVREDMDRKRIKVSDACKEYVSWPTLLDHNILLFVDHRMQETELLSNSVFSLVKFCDTTADPLVSNDKNNPYKQKVSSSAYILFSPCINIEESFFVSTFSSSRILASFLIVMR